MTPIQQSFRSKNHPTPGADPEADESTLIGGNKHSSTGGSMDEFRDVQGECERNARANHGIDRPALEYEDNFSEGDYPGSEKSIGATLDRGSID